MIRNSNFTGFLNRKLSNLDGRSGLKVQKIYGRDGSFKILGALNPEDFIKLKFLKSLIRGSLIDQSYWERCRHS